MTGIPEEIDTPDVVVDRDVLERNIERMAAAVRAKGLRLRPHAKTHKLPEIAALQRAAGAAGLTVATIGEAEVFAAHGADDLFLAYPLWVGPRQAQRGLQRGKAVRDVGATARHEFVQLGVQSHRLVQLGVRTGRIEARADHQFRFGIGAQRRAGTPDGRVLDRAGGVGQRP